MLGKAKDYLASHKRELFFLGLVFLLAFGIRGHMFIYELFFEFDGYYHARMAEYVLTHGSIPPTDPLAYYQLPGGAGNPHFADGPFWWLFTSTLYKILTFWMPYDKETFFIAIKLFPALFGALICLAMYYLGKEMYGQRAGAAMSIFAAVIPAFVYRTMAGWFEGQSLGFLWMVLGMIFLVRAIKQGTLEKSSIINALIASGFFALMGFTWQAFIMVPPILIGTMVLTAIITAARSYLHKEKPDKGVSVIAHAGLALVVFGVIAAAVIGTYWIDGIISNAQHVLNLFSVGRGGEAGQTEGSIFSVSVGEESQGKVWWSNKYNALSVFIGLPIDGFPWYLPGVVFIFLLYRILYKKDDHVTTLALVWIVFAIYLAYIKLKFTYYLGLPLAIAAGITVNDLLMFAGERPGFEKKALAFVLGFIFLVGIAAGSFFIYQNVPNIEADTGWKEALRWISQNTPENSRFFNWWDEGHWITFIGERAVTTDNRNMDLPTNSDYAKFVLSPSEEISVGILKSRYNPDYVIASEDLIEKMGSLALYADAVENQKPAFPLQGYQSSILRCQKVQNPLTKAVTVQCAGSGIGAEFSEDEYNLAPFKWIAQPNHVLNETQRVFVYRNEEGTRLYILNTAANGTFLSRLFFDKDNLGSFEQVYSHKDVRIFTFSK